MIDPQNIVMIQGGLTRDPEVNNDLVMLSVAVDNAGSVKDQKNASGFFDVKVWTNNSKYSPEAFGESIKNAIANGELKKGTRVSIVGRLVHERWETDKGKGSRVTITAESVTFRNFQKAAPAAQAVTGTESTFVADF